MRGGRKAEKARTQGFYPPLFPILFILPFSGVRGED